MAPLWEEMDADILRKIFDSIPSSKVRARASAVCRRWRDTEMARAWDELNVDLLEKIFALLPSATDKARASAVCRHWCATAKANPPPLPWLVMPSAAGVSYLKIFEGTLLEQAGAAAEFAAGGRFCGSFPGGWFVLSRQEPPRHALINRVSGHVTVLPEILRILEGEADQGLVFSDIPMVIEASAVSGPPGNGGGGTCTIAAVTSGHTSIAFWRFGMTHWTPPLPTAIEDRLGWRSMVPNTAVEDVLYRDGYFVVLGKDERVFWYWPVEAEDGMLTMKLMPVDALLPATAPMALVIARYLVFSSSGRFLLMARRMRLQHEVRFEILCRDEGSWLLLRELRNQALFVARGCSTAVQTSLPARIFFVDDAEWLQEGVASCNDTGVCLYRLQRQRIVRCLPRREEPASSQWTWWAQTLTRQTDLVEIAVAQPGPIAALLEILLYAVLAAIIIRLFIF